MFQASLQLYRKAYSGVSKPMWWLALVMLVNRSGTMVIPFLTVYLITKGYTLTQAGGIMALFGAGAIVGGFLGGYCSDRWGFFHVQFFSLLLNGFLFIVLNYMETLSQIAVCIFITSIIGEAFRPANAAAVVAYSTEENRTRSYSLNRLAVNLGWSVGPAIGGILAGISYSLLFWVDGLTCIAASIILFYFLGIENKVTPTYHKQKLDKGRSAYRDAVFIKAMFFLFLIAVCFFQLFNFLPVYYKSVVHLSEREIGWVLALNGVIIVALEMILVYKLENRISAIYYMVCACLLMGLSFLILLFQPSVSIVLLGILLITFAEMLLFPFTNKFWTHRSNTLNRGQYVAAYSITFAIAQVVAPTLSSQMAAHFGFPALWVTNFILCCAGAVGFYFLKEKGMYE